MITARSVITDARVTGLLMAAAMGAPLLAYAWLAASAPWLAVAAAVSILPFLLAVRSTARGRGEWLLLALFACVAFNEFLPDLLEIPGFRLGPEKVIILLGLLCLLLRGAIHEEWPLSKHAVTLPALAACALAFAHTMLAPDPELAMRRATSLSALVLMAHVVAGLAKRCDRTVLLSGIAWVLLSLGILSFVLHGLGITLGGEPAEGGRASGTLRNPNEWGAFCLAGLPFLFCLGMDDQTRRARKPFLAGGVVLLVSLALSLSRGAFVALAMVALFALLRAKKKKLVPLAAMALVLVLAADVLPLDAITARITTLIDPSTERGDSLTLRANYLGAGFKLFAESPIFGCGIGHYPLQAFRVADVMPGFDAHNTFMTILSETGIVGFLIAVWFAQAMASSLSGRRGARTAEVRGVALGLMALLFMGFSGTLYLKSYCWFWIGCAMGFAPRAEPAS